MPGRLRVRLRKSPISYTAKTRGTVRALGLHRLNDTAELPDTPAVRGMVRAVRFLVEVEEIGPAAHESMARESAARESAATAARGPAGDEKEETA